LQSVRRETIFDWAHISNISDSAKKSRSQSVPEHRPTLDIRFKHRAIGGKSSAEENACPTHGRTINDWPELISTGSEDAGVASIIPQRPEKRNSWNRALCQASSNPHIISADRELKIVITRWRRPALLSGLDLTFLREVRTARCSTGPTSNLTIQIERTSAPSEHHD